MDNTQKEHITFQEYQEQFEIWYRTHNIIREKAELYCDFLSSLLTLIDDTYLGADVLISDDDILNHFTWCFNKVVSSFEEERIFFTIKGTYFDYLWVFFYKAYYKCSTEGKTQILLDYFRLLFEFDKVKTPVELESFADLYKIFDQNLRKSN